MNRKLLVGALGVGYALAAVTSCGLDSREFRVSGLNPSGGTDASVAVPGVPVGDPVLGVAPAAIDLGQAVVGSPSRTRVSIANTGTGALVPPEVALVMGSDPDFIVLHDQCESPLRAAEQCDVRLQLLPSKPGPSSATLGVDADGQAAQVSLTATGLSAGPLRVVPAEGSSDFGGVLIGSTVEAFFDVSNPLPDDSGPLAVVLNEDQFQLLPPAADECQVGVTTLSNGQSCRLHVGFSPVRRGPTDALLVVTSPTLGSTGVPLAGRGALAPVLAAPDVVDFGNVVVAGPPGQRTLHIENQGDEPLPLTNVTLAMASTDPAGGAPEMSAFSVQSSDCGGGRILAGGAFCSVALAFRPLVAQPSQQAQLLVTATDGTEKAIALVGAGLDQGTLRISPAAGNDGDFGPLRVGTSATQVFTVSNPSQQPSGGLVIAVFDDFTLVPPSTDAECQPGITSLAGDQSCTITVALTPSTSGQHDGALTVSSSLAGAVHLPLTGRGIEPARLSPATEQLDFGRVPTDTPVTQVVQVTNSGEEPVSGLQSVLEGPGGGSALGFSSTSTCPPELGVGATCEISVQFLPTEAQTYSAVLRLDSPAAKSSVLLLGLAFPRGNLVLSPLGGSGDFGDVALGAPRTLQFTLSNSGGTPSGRLTINATNNLFAVDLGDCNLEGLDPGASCTLSISFAPTTSDQIAANLSIQSLVAGETALALSGRGRAPPRLTASDARDLGNANVNQEALREPANQFTWTVTNEGDLDSGVLAVSNSNGAEFVVSNDTCSNAVVAGGGTCTLDLRFRPSDFGARAATLTLTDALTSQALSLALSGTGIVIAAPGQSCVNAECPADTVCTGGTCCDRECVSSCQACSAQGVCVDQAERQPCGNGAGQCFGVDRCLLPEAQPCTGDDQCGSGQCEQRLGGTGQNDRICCLADCGTTGQQCNAMGQCQNPTLPAGAACGASGQLPCAAGLECKECLAGGRQCTPPDGCCGGCGTGYVCNAGECGCPSSPTGGPQLDCGGGVCFPNREFACCPATPDCPQARPVCDASQGLCVQCLSNADCGPCSNCSANNTCTPIARGQAGRCGGGMLCNGSGACFAPQCTGVGQCGDCRTCSDFSCVNAGAGATCSTGVCTAQQFCVQCIANAQCGAGQQCNTFNNTCECNANAGFRNCGNGCVQAQCCSPADCGGRACNGGTCQAAECTPGETRCSNTGVPQLCGQNGLFSNQGLCAVTQECVAGACVEPEPFCDNQVSITDPLSVAFCASPTYPYCVAPSDRFNFDVLARAACEECRGVACDAVDCGDPGSARGYVSRDPQAGNVFFIFEGGMCPNLQQAVTERQVFTPFDGVVGTF